MTTPKLLTAGIVTLLLGGFACSQRVEPEEEFASRERERPLLPRSAAPPALTGGPAGGPRTAASPAGPAAMAGSQGGDPAPDGPGVSGTVEAAGLSAPPSGAVLFVIVRPADRAGGPPLAVRRLTPRAFPAEFEIGPRDAMMGGGPFPDRVTVEARLDGDGDPLSRGPDDRSAQRVTVEPGATGVTLRLDAGG